MLMLAISELKGVLTDTSSRVQKLLLSFCFSTKLFFDVTFTLSIRDSILYYLKNQDSLLTDFLEKIARNSSNLEECSKG